MQTENVWLLVVVILSTKKEDEASSTNWAASDIVKLSLLRSSCCYCPLLFVVGSTSCSS